ncbi:MAG: hypothetical protein JW951_10470 [Lentisphaerae bacterium]|nr:hypothetical protein [Lentisphaerota bacterium]
MIYDYAKRLTVLLCVFLAAWSVVGQTDETAELAAEELLIEEALNGQLADENEAELDALLEEAGLTEEAGLPEVPLDAAGAGAAIETLPDGTVTAEAPAEATAEIAAEPDAVPEKGVTPAAEAMAEEAAVEESLEKAVLEEAAVEESVEEAAAEAFVDAAVMEAETAPEERVEEAVTEPEAVGMLEPPAPAAGELMDEAAAGEWVEEAAAGELVDEAAAGELMDEAVMEPEAGEAVADMLETEESLSEDVEEPSAETVAAEDAAAEDAAVFAEALELEAPADQGAEAPGEPEQGEAPVIAEDLDQVVEEAFREAIAEGVPQAPVLPEPAVPRGPAAPGVGAPAADVTARVAAEVARNAELSMLAESEILRRQAFLQHADDRIEAAEAALGKRRYQEAIRAFEQGVSALKQAGEGREAESLRETARGGLGEAYYRLALAYRQQRDLDNAEQAARSADAYGHRRAGKLLEMIAAAREAPEEPEAEEEERVARWRQPEYQEAQESIKERLRLGREYFITQEYDRAQLMFESVLKRDPHNTEAIRMLQKVTQKLYDIASLELESTRKDMMYQLRKTWSRRNYALAEEEGELEALAPRRRTPPEEAQARKRILDKMGRIVIPELDFRQANIHDVIDFLQEASVEFDKESEEGEQRGVNIILNLRSERRGEAGLGAGPADPFAAALEADTGTGGGAGTDVQSITFSARHISLLEALDIVTNVADLKYRIEGSVVMVVPSDAPAGAIVHRMYDVLPTVIERIGEIAPEFGTGGGRGGAGDFMTLESGGIGGDTVDLKEFFGGMGVQWPMGSSIKYIPALGKLVVANTADNLTVFENILSVLDVIPKQVEIEARFVEVLQTDLDSLGFEWILTDDWEVATKKGQGNVPVGGQQRIIVPGNEGSGGFTTGNRYLTEGLPGVTEAVPIADDVLSIAGVLTNPELTFVLHALQQKGSTDLLSAPKVTTQSGQEATIKVVTEYIYPTDFEVTEVLGETQTGTSIIIGGIVEPSGFETREVGVILSVLPEVSPEGQMINLTLQPEVVAEPTFKNYGTTYTDEEGREQQLNMEQPFFHTRSISTSILIYNGATVVMGGMITENRQDVDDKVPFLGDVPLIGRFFQSRYERSEKRNLLIFVTARLVDPAGIPVARPQGAIEEALSPPTEE